LDAREVEEAEEVFDVVQSESRELEGRTKTANEAPAESGEEIRSVR
jgi:hypothetical protein